MVPAPLFDVTRSSRPSPFTSASATPFGGVPTATVVVPTRLADPAVVPELQSVIQSKYNTLFEQPALVYPTVASDGARAQRL